MTDPLIAHVAEPEQAWEVFQCGGGSFFWRCLTSICVCPVIRRLTPHVMTPNQTTQPAPDTACDSDSSRIPPQQAKERQLLGLLGQTFWPGPLTLVAPAAAAIPGAVTAGTVRRRLPSRCCCRNGWRMGWVLWVCEARLLLSINRTVRQTHVRRAGSASAAPRTPSPARCCGRQGCRWWRRRRTGKYFHVDAACAVSTTHYPCLLYAHPYALSASQTP